MGISKLRALVQFTLGSHTLPIEQGRLGRPALPHHLRRYTVCDTQAVGEELHCVFHWPHFSEVRAQFLSLFQDAAGCMLLFMLHKDQKSVSHCLIALLQKAQTRTQSRPHKPGWLNGRSESSLASRLSPAYDLTAVSLGYALKTVRPVSVLGFEGHVYLPGTMEYDGGSRGPNDP